MTGPKFVTSQMIVRWNMWGTALFTVSAGAAALVFEGFAKTQGVVVSLALFGLGVVLFLWGYWRAVQRSRSDVMSVTELYFLVGPSIEKRTARIMNAMLAIQVIVAVTTAIIRGSTPAADGTSTPGSTLAFGVLVPTFGLGLNGLWSSMYGRFPRRSEPSKS